MYQCFNFSNVLLQSRSTLGNQFERCFFLLHKLFANCHQINTIFRNICQFVIWISPQQFCIEIVHSWWLFQIFLFYNFPLKDGKWFMRPISSMKLLKYFWSNKTVYLFFFKHFEFWSRSWTRDSIRAIKADINSKLSTYCNNKISITNHTCFEIKSPQLKAFEAMYFGIFSSNKIIV